MEVSLLDVWCWVCYCWFEKANGPLVSPPLKSCGHWSVGRFSRQNGFSLFWKIQENFWSLILFKFSFYVIKKPFTSYQIKALWQYCANATERSFQPIIDSNVPISMELSCTRHKKLSAADMVHILTYSHKSEGRQYRCLTAHHYKHTHLIPPILLMWGEQTKPQSLILRWRRRLGFSVCEWDYILILARGKRTCYR